ncbi:Uncharacterised protein [Streptococcus pneumoniae]|nr:Uncharacterised protein [Streptococcus pneumoniae]
MTSLGSTLIFVTANPSGKLPFFAYVIGTVFSVLLAVACVATFNVTLILDGLVLTFKRFPSLLYNVTSAVFVTVLLTPFKSTYALADEILSISSFVPTTSTVSGLMFDFSRVAPAGI